VPAKHVFKSLHQPQQRSSVQISTYELSSCVMEEVEAGKGGNKGSITTKFPRMLLRFRQPLRLPWQQRHQRNAHIKLGRECGTSIQTAAPVKEPVQVPWHPGDTVPRRQSILWLEKSTNINCCGWPTIYSACIMM